MASSAVTPCVTKCAQSSNNSSKARYDVNPTPVWLNAPSSPFSTKPVLTSTPCIHTVDIHSYRNYSLRVRTRWFVVERPVALDLAVAIYAEAVNARGMEEHAVDGSGDESYRTCPACGSDCPSEVIGGDGGVGLRIVFVCAVHGVHSVVDPFA